MNSRIFRARVVVAFLFVAGAAQAATFNGTAGDDSLSGGDGHDVLIGGLGNDSLAGGNGYDVAVVKALKRTLIESGGNTRTVTTPDGTDTIASDVEAVRFIDGTTLVTPLSAPILTSDGFLILPRWTSTSANPVRIEIANAANGNILGLLVTSSDGRISAPLTPPRLAGIDVSNVSGPVRITGVTFTPAADAPADGTAASSNIGRLVYNDAQGSVTVNNSEVDLFKALFLTYDPLYVEGIPLEAKYYANLQFVRLGARYANWLEASHAPVLDFIVKTIGDRQQSLHDNLLGNIREESIRKRISPTMQFPQSSLGTAYTYESLYDEFLRSTPASRYIDRPYYSGSASDPNAATNAAKWDVISGIARSDTTTFANGTIILAADADHDGSVDTLGTQPSIAAAINAANDGDAIVLMSGTYTEAVIVTKPLSIRAVAGGSVSLIPASTARAVTIRAATGDADGLGGGAVTLTGLRIENAASGIYVMTNARAGMLTLDRVTVAHNGQFGLYLEGDGTGVAGGNGAASLVVRDSTFVGNGSLRTPSSNAKLYGFTGDATFLNVVVTGEGSGASLGDYGIDFVGVPNSALASIIPTTRLGNVRFTNVTVRGPFRKNAVAFYNYGDVNRLTIDSLDLSLATAGWIYVLNFDGITASYDASAYGLTLPAGTRVQTALQGDKSGQAPTPQQIIGTSRNDLVQGKDANDDLAGGSGNDALNGGAGADTLRGGADDDVLYGGDDVTTDFILGGIGNDEAVFPGNPNDYRIDYVLPSASSAESCSNGTSTAARVTRLSNSSFDCAWEIERLVFVSDVPTYLLTGTGVNGVVSAGAIVGGGQAGSFTSLQAAVSAASAGSVITVNAPVDLSGEGLILISQDNLTVQGPAGTVVVGFVLASNATTFHLAGNFDAKVVGNDAANRIFGNAGANVIDGHGGDDIIVGGGGNDRLSGGNGNDLIVLSSSGSALGGAGEDRIVVAGGNADILGGSGSDTIIVGAVDRNTNLQVHAVVADFVPGADTVNLGGLNNNGAAPTLSDVLTGAVSTETPLNLDGLRIDGGSGTISGSLTLYLLDELQLSNEDFIFVDSQEAWRTDAQVTP